MMTTAELLQWSGCVTGILGSLLLAMKTSRSGWGFVAYLFSNCLWAAYGLQTGAPGLVAMQAAFTATSAFGVWRWLIHPKHQ